MEPAAVLVCALEINIGRPWQVGLAAENGDMARAGFKPNIDYVGLFNKFCAAAAPAFGAGGKSIGLGRVPSVGTEAAEEFDNFPIKRRIIQRLTAPFAQKYGNRHAPHALARDTPVWACGDHVRDALFAPSRVPLHFFDFVQRAAAQSSPLDRCLHRDEPLLGGAEDNRIVAAPAVRI